MWSSISGAQPLDCSRPVSPSHHRMGIRHLGVGSAGCGSPAAMADPEPRPGRQHDDHDRDHHAHGRAGVPTRAAPRAQGDGIAGASGLPLPGRAVAAGTAGRAGGCGRARLGVRSALAVLGGRRRGGGGRARRGGTAVPSTGRRRGRPGRRDGGAVTGGAVAGGLVGGGAQLTTEQKATKPGAPPVPYRQPSTDPSTTVVLPAPPREYVQPPAPGAARKYAQYWPPGPMRHDWSAGFPTPYSWQTAAPWPAKP